MDAGGTETKLATLPEFMIRAAVQLCQAQFAQISRVEGKAKNAATCIDN